MSADELRDVGFPTQRPDELTNRLTLPQGEYDVLQLMIAGRTDKEIAEELGISRWTVRSYILRLKTRLNFRTRTGVVAYAVGLEMKGTPITPSPKKSSRRRK